MPFSGALTLTDLNDFITPSQACIKPVEPVKAGATVKEAGAASTEIRVDSTGAYYEVSADRLSSAKPLEKAQVNLNDCLACSGCITSAESVLITIQSHAEVLNFLESNSKECSSTRKIPVLSIAPQSLASIAASLSSSSKTPPISLRQVLRRVQMFCKKVLGFEHVYDTTFARHIARSELAQEFSERKRGMGRLPMLSSACPGWICYAEKAHSEILPFISRTRSPQQIMGVLVKSWMGSRWGKQPDDIYHVSVMPCYDKKLEASRQDFYNEQYSTRDVDCVITTGELELMMLEKGWDIASPMEDEDVGQVPLDDAHRTSLPELLSHPGTSSGSYLHSLISEITAASAEPLDLSVRTIRTADYEEYTLTKLDSGHVVFKGAKCYGFRNLQNVVRKVGREAGVQVGKGAAGKVAGGLRARARKMEGTQNERGYDYVEVMACPGGCVNGGGQLRPPRPTLNQTEDEEGYKRNWEENGVRVPVASAGGEGASQGGMLNPKWGDKEWTKKVEQAYWHGLPTPPASPKLDNVDLRAKQADALAARILSDLCQPSQDDGNLNWATVMDDDAEARRRELFRTQYRAVESEVVGLAVKW